MDSIELLANGFLQGSRVALAKAITLVESTLPEHRKQAEELFRILPKPTQNTIRIAISGPPGVGKSSFIETIGLHITSQGKKLAVLAIDPSSPLTGGSILGDKTRMEELSKSELSFIRPSPSSCFLGGVARHTKESLMLCEAAGFDVIIIETVGIGQSEVLAASMTDHFIHLHQPMSGDELQGIKKGVMELADLVIVTKSDGPMETAARLAKVEIERALSLTRIDHSDIPKVYLSSILNSKGNEDIWKAILELQEKRFLNGYISRKREEQNKNWLAQEITTSLKELLESHPNYDLELSNSQLALSKNNTLCGSIARNFVSKLVKLNSI